MKAALKVVEMPVRRTVEVGRNGIVDRAATTLETNCEASVRTSGPPLAAPMTTREWPRV
jgi:hypothetical protein